MSRSCENETTTEMENGAATGMIDKQPCQVDCLVCAESYSMKAAAKGELIEGKQKHTSHADIVGPFDTPSAGNARYFLSLVVGKLRFGKLVLMRSRSEDSTAILNFIHWIEWKSTQKVQAVHSDGAKEFLALEKKLNSLGIKLSTSSRYSPASYGVAERYNRTIHAKHDQ